MLCICFTDKYIQVILKRTEIVCVTNNWLIVTLIRFAAFLRIVYKNEFGFALMIGDFLLKGWLRIQIMTIIASL